MKFPLAKGSRMELVHDLANLQLGMNQVSVISSAPLQGQSEVYQVRFEALASGQSKSKYWEKVTAVFEQRKLAKDALAQKSEMELGRAQGDVA